ncbi:MAG TPA: YXWGXW repeat-containing protein [Usitatibacter sp.]|jgi:hypothetical protein|nr:YXWGXW repeat-containing protein [Usitatibacter sp.]
MNTKLIAALAVAAGFSAAPAMSATVQYVEVQAPPPALQVETVPAPTSGQVWVPGYYDYRDGQYAWVSGHFEPERVGYVYVAPRYEHGKYYVSRWDEDKTYKVKEKHGKIKVKEKDKD